MVDGGVKRKKLFLQELANYGKLPENESEMELKGSEIALLTAVHSKTQRLEYALVAMPYAEVYPEDSLVQLEVLAV